jgi:lipopolysaccharide export system permease protein
VKRVERLVFQELLGPFLFGALLFTGLIFATTLLLKITDWTVRGVSPSTIAELVVLLLPGVIIKTLGMALLLASLLAFGRLSNDGEIVALRAAGASLFRVMRPVFLFSLGVAVLGFAISETLIPVTALQATAISTQVKKELDRSKDARPLSQSILGKDGLAALVVARDFDLGSQTLRGVTIIKYAKGGEVAFYLQADRLRYVGPRNWAIEGAAKMWPADFSWIAEIPNGAWPKEIERPTFTPLTILAGFADDADSFSFNQLREEIARKREDPITSRKQLVNLEFGLYNKVAIPLGQVIFALLGASLGIRNVRTGMGSGFALSIAMSFGYMLIVNFLAVYAKGGSLPAWVASFTPVAVGFVAACITIAKKNS